MDHLEKLEKVHIIMMVGEKMGINKEEYIVYTEEFVSNKKVENKNKIITVLAISCFVLLFLFLYQLQQTTTINKTVEKQELLIEQQSKDLSTKNISVSNLRSSLSDAQSTANLYKDKATFLDNYIVMVTSTGSRYHKYGCKYLKDRTFWVYNVENAKYKGYVPCGECCKD